MRSAILACALVAAVAFGDMAAAEPTQPKPAKDSPTDVSEAVVQAPAKDPDPQICRRVAPTGSRIGVKVCKKKSEWAARSGRRRTSNEGPTVVDGFDDQLAPLPPSN